MTDSDCPECHGTTDCLDCEGTGRSEDNHDADGDCMACDGTGICGACDLAVNVTVIEDDGEPD